MPPLPTSGRAATQLMTRKHCGDRRGHIYCRVDGKRDDALDDFAYAPPGLKVKNDGLRSDKMLRSHSASASVAGTTTTWPPFFKTNTLFIVSS